jgi:hypothetical protein
MTGAAYSFYSSSVMHHATSSYTWSSQADRPRCFIIRTFMSYLNNTENYPFIVLFYYKIYLALYKLGLCV